ncbi:Predicted phosphodiesterase [Nonlabens sp. Hel1_33_55]|uniref:metallophosphoesterase family protein n=1 Tax=Nonlabens sp. Hel1_33_55 TaxID=1336802 RepID=UPI000875B034|nr:metallophosphoesterase [Nonlabens sp. Hel1_33_55]SCX94691.1 Predicted phosphodiesterase [Nonlabens sp. Hel1_33_55]
MRLLVMGDIHGNLPALEKTLSIYRDNVDAIVCHGDVVNYGPWSNECVQLLHEEKIICLLGNHEEAYLQGYYPGNNAMVKDFFDVTFSTFTHIDKLKNYATQLIIDDYLITHTINNRYYYPDSDLSGVDLKQNTIIGHSHYPFIRKTENSNYLINTGSIGQNRKDLAIINFLILDTLTGKAEIIDCHHDTGQLISKMVSLNYPKVCLDYYRSKLH